MELAADRSGDHWRRLLVQLAELNWGRARATEIESELVQMAEALARISARAPIPEAAPGTVHA